MIVVLFPSLCQDFSPAASYLGAGMIVQRIQRRVGVAGVDGPYTFLPSTSPVAQED